MPVNNPPLVLLDLQNEYQNFEEIFDSQVFCRFTDKIRCLEHVSTRPANIRALHFFIPKSEHTIIGPNIIFSNTIYYIYCIDNPSIDEMNEQYHFPMFVKIFNADSLWMNLQGASIAHWIEQANRTQHQPDEHDVALQAGAELSNALAEKLREHMIFKIGMQPDD